MIIGVDFDRVLFDTVRFNKELKEATGLHHVDGDVYDEDGNYSPSKHAELCGVDPEKVYDFLEEGLEEYLYEDIDLLKDTEHEVWIVTRGEEKFQRAKIENCGIEDFFDRVKVVENGSKDVGVDFLIDDRNEELERVDVPGFRLERSKNSLEDALKEAGEYAT